MKTWPFILAFALICYATGAAFVESFVNYPSWRLVGAAEFVRYHQFITPRVVAFLVVPALLGSIATAVMLWHRPAVIPRAAVWLALVLQGVNWVSTAFIQIPMQTEFSAHGFSEPLLVRLMISSFWLRRIPSAVTLAIFLWLMHRVIAATLRSDADPAAGGGAFALSSRRGYLGPVK